MLAPGMQERAVELLEHWCQRLFPVQAEMLQRLLTDVGALYRGESTSWQRCQVPYHTIEHVCSVTMVALQIYAGECSQRQVEPQTEQLKVLAAAALFHDSGYLKAHTDNHPDSGGQYTFEHVERSQLLAQTYLAAQQGWSLGQRQAVTLLIGATKIVDDSAVAAGQPVVLEAAFVGLADILASADLLAQVADKYYLEKLPLLYAEFVEAYAWKGRDYLRQHGFMVFDDYAQLLASSGAFIRQKVLPRLHDLGDKEMALQNLFSQHPSPYMCQLQANLRRIDVLASS